MKFYTGVGSRSTPEPILRKMTAYAKRLSQLGWWLRSGGAIGADRAFEAGSLRHEIYTAKQYICEGAFKLAESIHPNWKACSAYAKRLHARNTYQVLGPQLATPSAFVLCWTPCGAECEQDTTRKTGGTRTAIVLASREGIPVFNFYHPDVGSRLGKFLETYVPPVVVVHQPDPPF